MFDLLHIKKEGGKAMTIDGQGNFLEKTFYFFGSKSKFYSYIICKKLDSYQRLKQAGT